MSAVSGTKLNRGQLLRVAVWALLALAATKVVMGLLTRWLFPGASFWAEVMIDMALVLACAAPVVLWRLWLVLRDDQASAVELSEARRREASANEARYRAIIDGADLLAWEFCVEEDRFIYVSFEYERHGYSKSRWMQPGFWDSILHDDDREPVTNECLAEIKAGRPHRLNYRVRAADGRVLHISDYVSAPEVHDGRTIVRGVAVDVTAQRQAQAKLAESELTLRTLADSAPMFVWTSGLDGKRDYFNRTWLEFRGRSLEEEKGDGWMEGVHKDDLQHYLKAMKAAFAERRGFELEYRLLRRDGSYRLVLGRGTPRLDSNGDVLGYVGACTDMTEIREAQGRAESASKAKSEFLANMSHEIRTPLTAILGFADILREDGEIEKAPANRIQCIDTIRLAGQHLLTVINDILDLSKIEAGKIEVEQVETTLPNLLGEVASILRPRALGKGVRLDVQLVTPIPRVVKTDPTRLRQILMNLAGNAVKFTEAGVVRILIALRKSEAGEMLVVDVIDTGPGMSAEQVQRLFQPFSQVDSTMTRKHGGSGLGLTICRRLAALMEGDVKLVESELGQGSTFRLELPLVYQAGSEFVSSLDVVAALVPKRASGTVERLNGRILLAEDGLDNQRLIAFHLRKAGATVEVAENGRVALEKVVEAAGRGESFDLLLTDMQMPEMDGYTLCRRLRRMGSRMAIVALTAHAMAEDREKCLAAGCDDYVSKPIEKGLLLNVCDLWIGRESVARALKQSV